MALLRGCDWAKLRAALGEPTPRPTSRHPHRVSPCGPCDARHSKADCAHRRWGAPDRFRPRLSRVAEVRRERALADQLPRVDRVRQPRNLGGRRGDERGRGGVRFHTPSVRCDLAWLALLLPLGVLAQAVVGGFTVREHLTPGFVMGQFTLSMLVLIAAVALAWRSAHEPGTRPRATDRGSGWSVRALLPPAALTIFAVTAASAAGPHASGSPGQRIHRLGFKAPTP